jgi:hypothetical protein
MARLPDRMVWRGDIACGLVDRDLARWMCEIVLREARTVAELEAWLDARTVDRVGRALPRLCQRYDR